MSKKDPLIAPKSDEKPFTQSGGLSERHKKMSEDGRHLTDDSSVSEATLNEAMRDVISYATECFQPLGYTIEHQKTISLFDCQTYFHAAGGPPPHPENQKVSMKPDGGILFAVGGGKRIPILIVEDKVQGTNDSLFQKGLKRQATGNAIERGAKNIRGAEMLFAGLPYFSYALFASGCDFHSIETIAKRIEMMNMGIPNHYVEVSPSSTAESISTAVAAITPSIQLICGKSIASVFVKAHQWNEMPHASSRWKNEEIVQICKKIIDRVAELTSKRDT